MQTEPQVDDKPETAAPAGKAETVAPPATPTNADFRFEFAKHTFRDHVRPRKGKASAAERLAARAYYKKHAEKLSFLTRNY